MNKFYLHTLPQPYHLSVGAVLFNKNFDVCVHHFFKAHVPEKLQFLMEGQDEVWHLVRESVEGEELLSTAVHRGLYEEFGARGEIERYLGAIDCKVETPTRYFQKTTLYHAVRLTELGERPQIDEESKTEMEWHSPLKILEIFEVQKQKTNRPELDESIIIKRFIDAYGL